MIYAHEQFAAAAEEHLVVTARRRQVCFSYQGSSFSLGRSKAVQYLVELLLHPYQSISSTALYALVNHQPPRHSTPGQAGLGPESAGPAFHSLMLQPLADPLALHQVRQRLNLLTVQLAETEDGNDLARAEELRLERDSLLDYLQQSLSAHWSARRQADQDHRCRDNVYHSLQRVLRAISLAHPALGLMLENSLQLWGELLFVPAPQLSVIVQERL